VSVVIAILIEVVERFIKVMAVPIGYATDDAAGIVYVAGPAPVS